MDAKKANLVADIAHSLIKNNATLPVTTLVDILNHNQFTTQRGVHMTGGEVVTS